MSTIRHLVWHDIRALRLPLAAWYLVLLAQAAVMAFGPGLIDPEARSSIVTFAGFLAGARLAFTILLTVLLVQRDSPVGTTAFWVTRPIPPTAMAASKLSAAALLLVVVPAVVGWLLFTALGLSRGDVLDGVWMLVVEQAMVVGLSAMGAVITATIPQFAVVAVVAVLLIGSMSNEVRPLIDRLPKVWLPIEIAPVSAWAFVTVLGAAAVAVYQYSRRHVVRAAAAATAVLMIGVLSALTMRGWFDAGTAEPLRAGVLDPAVVTLEVEPRTIRAESGSTNDAQGRPTRSRYAGAVLRTSGAPLAVVLQPWSIESTWQPGGASPVRWQRRRAAAYRRSVRHDADVDGQPLGSIANALGSVELLSSMRSDGTAFWTTLLSLPEEDASRVTSAHGPLDAQVTLRAWRYRVIEAVPLGAGSAVSARQGRLTVRTVRRTRDTVLVDARSVFLQRLWWRSEDLFGFSGVGSAEHLAIRNTSRKQAILLAGESSRQIHCSLLSGLSSFQLGTGARRLRFVVPLSAGDRVEIDEEWLSGAELIVLRPEDLGVFTRPLRVEWVNLDSVK